jgi:ATP-binding cassette, subfamily B, bacterial
MTFQEEEYTSRIDPALWRRIIRHARPYLPQLLGMGATAMLVAGVDVLFPLVTAWLIDEAIMDGLTGQLLWYALGYAGLCAVMAVCIWIFIVLAGRIATGLAHDLRRQGFERLQQLSFSYFDTRPVGWLVTRLTSDVDKLSSIIPWFLLDLVWGSCLVIGITVAMLLLYWPLGVAVLVIVPPLVIVSIYFQRRLLESSRNIRKTNSQITAAFNEAIIGVRTTKALVRERESLEEFKTLSSSMFGHCMRNALQSAVYLPLVIAIGSLGVGLALWRGGAGVLAGEEALTLGVLVAFMQYAALFHMPIEELARQFTNLQSAQAAAERVQTLLDTEPEIRDSPVVIERIRQQRGAPEEPGIAMDGGRQGIERIEFRDVSFWYKPDEPVLQKFNLAVNAGQTVALVGATGGGKSTIVSLLARFSEPCAGSILIDGIDYRQRSLHWLQSKLGIVLQSPFLFSGSVRENIRYGRLEAGDEEVIAAARLVNAHGFITELEGGYDSDVGQGGQRLSTGQRQLVALARAVLADPQILILDEATSSVDTETERLIQEGINSVLRGRTSFVIAHRLSTIRAADVILVIESGRIAEQGGHVELMRRRGRYYELYAGQFARQREQQCLRGEREKTSALHPSP